jgi:sialic acid synthase SpsE
MVQAVRDVECALGNNIKAPQPSEIKNKSIVRKSLVVAKDIKKGEIFQENNLAVKRPGYGLAPINYWQLLGSVATRDYQEDEVVDKETIKNS